MKTKLLFGLLFIATLQFTNAQTVVSLIGEFNGWGADVDLTTTDNVNYTLTGWTLAADSQIKFRQDHDWATAWGATSGTGWPSGTGNTTGGGPNISAIAGTYDVTFDFSTGNYSFSSATLAIDDFTKNIQFYYSKNALNINGYTGKISINAFDILGRLLYSKEDVQVQNGFSKNIDLPKGQLSLFVIEGAEFTKRLKVIAL